MNKDPAQPKKEKKKKTTKKLPMSLPKWLYDITLQPVMSVFQLSHLCTNIQYFLLILAIAVGVKCYFSVEE